MKLVFVTPFMRVPPDFGLAIRDFYFLQNFAKRHHLVIASFETPTQGDVEKWVYEIGAEFYSLGCIETGPRTSKFALLKRVFSYPPSSFGRISRDRLGLQLGQLLAEHSNVEAIILNTHLLAQASLAPSWRKVTVPAIAVFADVQTIYARRQYNLSKPSPYKVIYLSEWFRTALYERKIARQFAHIAVMSEQDAQVIRRYNPKANILVSPNGVDTKQITPVSVRRAVPPNLLYVANFGYAPNVDGFFFLYQEVMPLVWKQIPDVRLTVVGNLPSADMVQAGHADARIQIVGAVKDLTSWYASADVVTIPLRLGSGVKLKLLEAFAYGVPVVTTSVGLEGIAAAEAKLPMPTDRPEDFALRVLELVRNPELRIEIAARERSLVESKYDWASIVEQFEPFIAKMAWAKNIGGKVV